MVINLFETWCFQKLIHFWNSVFKFVFVMLCDAYITHAATDKPHRADHRETVHITWFRHVFDDLELKIFFVGQPWRPTCFMLHLPRKLGPHLKWNEPFLYFSNIQKSCASGVYIAIRFPLTWIYYHFLWNLKESIFHGLLIFFNNS